MALDKVFGSDITRTLNELNNNLYDLVTVDPVKPLPTNNTKHLSCDFVPKTDKYFVPKNKFRFKVRTVRAIRNLFEQDICNTLSIDLEKQQNILFRQIKGGSAKNEKTKLLAKNMLKSEKPISRMAWQMVININSEDHAHPSQFVLWNGKCIQVLGSRGGKSKFICKYDLDEPRASLLQKYELKKRKLTTKKNVLKNSLDVKFQPGPLSRKMHLDISHQKYNIGNIELAHLPKLGLDLLPEYGKPLETSVTNFLHNLRDENGMISNKWAEFAVATLGVEENGRAVQLNSDCCVTFELDYEYAQRRLLMRRDIDSLDWRQRESQTMLHEEHDKAATHEIKDMLDKMLISVEINLMQNDMYTGQDSPREVSKEDITNNFESQHRDKCKRRGELNRLDVTVIRLSDTEEKKKIYSCLKSFCSLGCVCDSIQSSFNLKNHCGNFECMFECKCNFTKYNIRGFEDDIIPSLVNLDKENSLKLAKEEQKFHQTVILSGEKSILLKSHKRSSKAPKKYADFYSNMSLNTKKKKDRILSVVDIKLNCANIEPWCMIHNLYKCFCKGKFTERLCNNTISSEGTKIIDATISSNKLNLEENLNLIGSESTIRSSLRQRTRLDLSKSSHIDSSDNIDTSPANCARTKAYGKRKYDDIYYYNANKRIVELEQNDHGLRKRMKEILNSDESTKKRKCGSDDPNIIDLSASPVLFESNESLNEVEADDNDDKAQKCQSSPVPTYDKFNNDYITTQFSSPIERNLNLKLKAWLEPSLKNYRQRFGNGFSKKSLDPPKAGKIALYPWNFIISRYHEKKNHFLVTNQKPFRIFMAVAVDGRNSLFNNCINISTITDFDAYPVSVRNILTKEICSLKDQLCILRGLNTCWELVGSIKKVCDRRNSDSEDYASESSSDKDGFLVQNSTNSTSFLLDDTSSTVPIDINSEQSRWFVMTIENDFSEIQFYKRGFFVKYESITKAINVARISEKTVRLSSQKRIEGNSDPQFGIYAIPHANKYCVFIGPYEINEPLGIETIKTTLYDGKSKTRGVWITTNKVDNLQVIDNPMSFMSQVNSEQEQILDNFLQDETNKSLLPNVANNNVNKSKEKEQENNKFVKLVKPIKIAKTNNFYHLTSSGLLEPMIKSPEKPNLLLTKPFVLNKRLSLDFDTSSTNTPLQSIESNKNTHIEDKQALPKRPIAEIAPQVKVVDCTEKSPDKKFECGMFILKPEEINNRALVHNINCTSLPSGNDHDAAAVDTEADSNIDMDIESFLANSVECSAPNTDDVFVISDDEDYCTIETNLNNKWKDVWIVCRNILNIGWISGREDSNKYLSFEFPGFKFTEFYSREEAFEKINQVLARKIYVPEQLNLNWGVLERKEDVEKLNINKLKPEDLNSDYVLTKKGLLNKYNLAEQRSSKKTATKDVSAKKSPQIIKAENQMLEPREIKGERESESDVLEKQGETLYNEAMEKKNEISNSLFHMTNDRRQQISDRLRSIISNTNSS